MKVGDKVSRRPVSFGEREDRLAPRPVMTGRIVYIHPKGRFHIVEFDTPGGPIRESFHGT